ncbi:MAG: hypothetical protein ACXV3S_09580 [Kineosporiaceae bacterium]
MQTAPDDTSSPGIHPERPRTAGGTDRHHTGGLVGELNADWRRLVADAGTRSVVARWGQVIPDLRGLADLDAVLVAGRRSGDREVLRGLLHLARDGDRLAARTALQIMLGSAVRLARRTRAHAGGDLEEAMARAVAATWQVVSDYPLERRTCRPADGISLDVLAILTQGRRARFEVAAGLPADLADVPEEEPTGPGERREAFWSTAKLGRPRLCGDEQLIMVLAWGVRVGAISAADARLLLRLHSPDDPERAVSCRAVAAEEGLGHAAVRQRASRATRRLAGVVQNLLAVADPPENRVSAAA